MVSSIPYHVPPGASTTPHICRSLRLTRVRVHLGARCLQVRRISLMQHLMRNSQLSSNDCERKDSK
jgi:hypothetical protein